MRACRKKTTSRKRQNGNVWKRQSRQKKQRKRKATTWTTKGGNLESTVS